MDVKQIIYMLSSCSSLRLFRPFCIVSIFTGVAALQVGLASSGAIVHCSGRSSAATFLQMKLLLQSNSFVAIAYSIY